MTGTEEGLVKGKSAEEKRKPERFFSGHRVKNFVTVIRVDGELPKEQIREDAKPLEELTFTSALPFSFDKKQHSVGSGDAYCVFPTFYIIIREGEKTWQFMKALVLH